MNGTPSAPYAPNTQCGRPARARCRIAWLIAFAVTVSGCNPAGTNVPAATSTASPKAVLERLVRLRAERRYPEMSPLIVRDQSSAVITTLLAIDDFIAANERLRSYVRDHVGGGLADEIDQSPLAADLEIFSRTIEFLDEKITGDSSRVGFLANNTLPVRQALLARTSTGWRYDPGGGGDPRLAEAFSRMARALDQCRSEMQMGRLKTESMSENPEPLLREIRTRLSPAMRELRELSQARKPSP